MREQLSLSGAVLKADRETGIVEAIVNTGETVDAQGDNLKFGCWQKVINEGRRVAIAWNHNPGDIRGKVLELRELPPGDVRLPANQKGTGSASGLWMRGQFALETKSGKEAFALVKGNYVNEWSVGFDLPADGSGEQRDRSGRTITLVDRLYEVSPVLAGASPDTVTLLAKSLFGDDYADEPDGESTVPLSLHKDLVMRAQVKGFQTGREAGQQPVDERVLIEKLAKRTAEEAEQKVRDRDYLMAIQFAQDRTAFAHCRAAYYRTLARGISV